MGRFNVGLQLLKIISLDLILSSLKKGTGLCCTGNILIYINSYEDADLVNLI